MATRNLCQRSSRVQSQSTHALQGQHWSSRSEHTPAESPGYRSSAGRLASQPSTGTTSSQSSRTSWEGNPSLQHLRSHQDSQLRHRLQLLQSTRRRLRHLRQQNRLQSTRRQLRHLPHRKSTSLLHRIRAQSFRTTCSTTCLQRSPRASFPHHPPQAARCEPQETRNQKDTKIKQGRE